MSTTTCHLHNNTDCETYEGGGLHSAINLGTTMPKWNQGKKPDRLLSFSFLFCLPGKNQAHSTLKIPCMDKNNACSEKFKNPSSCALQSTVLSQGKLSGMGGWDVAYTQ